MRKQSTGITPREVEIVHLIGAGLTNKEVAARLGISERTVGTHLERLFARLGVHSRAQALAWYQGAVDPNAIEALVAMVTAGELDSDLPLLYNTIGERLHAIEAAHIANGLAGLSVGDRVRIGHDVSPGYRPGLPATVVKRDTETITIQLDHPAGKFIGGRTRAPLTAEKTGTRTATLNVYGWSGIRC